MRKKSSTYFNKKSAFIEMSAPVFYAMLLAMVLLTIYNNISSVNEEYVNEMESEKPLVLNFYNSIFYEDGYINSTEQPWCSDAQTLTDVTAHRVAKCKDIKNIVYKEAPAGFENVPEQSYLLTLGRFKDGCKHYMKNVPGVSTKMYLYVECDLGLNRISPELVEADLDYFFSLHYPREYVTAHREAISLDVDSGGTWHDGKIRITFEK